MANERMKRCSKPYSKKCKLEPSRDTTPHLSAWPSSINQQTTSVGKDVVKREPLCTVVGIETDARTMEKQYGASSENEKKNYPMT